MKIAIIAPGEIPARRANTLQVMKMTQALSALGHSVQLIAPRSGKSKPADWKSLARHYGLQHEIPIIWLPANPRLRRYDFSFLALGKAWRWKADLIYTRLPQAAAAASRFGFSTIYEIHDLPQGSVGPWLFRIFMKSKGTQRLVVITKALANDLQAIYGLPIEPPFTIIAPDGIDLARYANLPAPAQARELLRRGSQGHACLAVIKEQFTVGYTGHLYPGRGIELLFNLAGEKPDVNFLIVGGEPRDVAQWRAEAKTRNLDNVCLTGFIPNSELPLYQAACEVLLMPYQKRVAASSGGDIARYLSPMKLFEYLACQRAIISSNLEVLQEVLNPHNAILLPCDDWKAWGNAIQSLQNDANLKERLAAQARQDANRYTWEARAKQILENIEPGT